MKNTSIFFIALLTSLLFTSCTKKSLSENNYYTLSTDSIQTGGVKVIPITTPKGTFNVWTKRIGNNPKVKVLLLNGGPGATHEYFECFENFLPATRIKAEAFLAQLLLKSPSEVKICPNTSSPRLPTKKRQGCPLNADGAQRAASRMAVKSSFLITADSSNERGLRRVAIISWTGTEVSAFI